MYKEHRFREVSRVGYDFLLIYETQAIELYNDGTTIMWMPRYYTGQTKIYTGE